MLVVGPSEFAGDISGLGALIRVGGAFEKRC